MYYADQHTSTLNGGQHAQCGGGLRYVCARCCGHLRSDDSGVRGSTPSVVRHAQACLSPSLRSPLRGPGKARAPMAHAEPRVMPCAGGAPPFTSSSRRSLLLSRPVEGARPSRGQWCVYAPPRSDSPPPHQLHCNTKMIVSLSVISCVQMIRYFGSC